MFLSQARTVAGERFVVVRDDGAARRLEGETSVYALAMRALAEGEPLAATIARLGLAEEIDLDVAEAQGRLLVPIDHPDPAHTIVAGTGLTHLGSAATRDAMHTAAKAETSELTDSMKMFNMGLEGGRPEPGAAGVQPEWFYKGDGSILAAPGAPLAMPEFSGDGGEEPELAGIYVVAPDGAPRRIGYALANEFSDHVTERVNYLWLAHSKLRPASIGPEIRLGELPASVDGTSRILRDGTEVFSKPFSSGEENMSHTLANLEHHHFKYPIFRRPGDVHIHMFGTATLSFADGIRTEPGDIFEIEAAAMGRPLRNSLAVAASGYAAAKPL